MGEREAVAALIEKEHETPGKAAVSRALFGTADPLAITRVYDEFCRERLGALTACVRFYRVSAGAVLGVDLGDGRSVVLKASRAGRRREYLSACREVMRHLASAGFPCPLPIGDPMDIGGARIAAEELVLRGAPADAHDPQIRLAIAVSLADLVRLARPFTSHPAFGGAWFTSLPEGRVFPAPHSPRFDFDGTREGAEWIEELAREARSLRNLAVGERVIGHFDWRVEHLRFEGNRVVASFDWDSLHSEREPVLVGSAAHGFTADWERDEIVRVPSIEEMRAFVSDYESARGQSFSREERTLVFASCLYSMCYTARCNHAANAEVRGQNGDYRPALEAWGRELLARE